MPAVYLWWIGVDSPDGPALGRLGNRIAETFELRVTRWDATARPADTLDVRRQQHSSTSILRWLNAHRPPDALRLLGLTDVDLFIPVLTFVYGEAQLNGRCAVVSTARLGPPAGAEGRVALSRLAKECIHELGHTFGLLHCGSPRCVMSRSVNLAAVDGKDSHLCGDCRLRYVEHLARQGMDHE
jgi:archaemetzincin